MRLKQQFVSFLSNTYRVLLFIWQSSPWLTICALLMTLIQGLLPPLNFILEKYFIDAVIAALATPGGAKPDFTTIFVWLGALFFTAVFTHLLMQLSRYTQELHQGLLKNYITTRIMQKSRELDLSFFETPEFYNKIEKVFSESFNRPIIIFQSIVELTRSLVTLSASVVIVVTLGPIILLLIFLTAIPMFYVNLRLSRKTYDMYNERIPENRFVRYLQYMMFSYISMKEIKIFRLGGYIQNLVLSMSKKHLDERTKLGQSRLKQLTIVDVINTLVSFGFKVFVVIRTITERLTIGTMNMYIGAITSVDNAVRTVFGTISNLYTNYLYIENLFSYLNLKPQIPSDPQLPAYDGRLISSIQFKNVSFKYPNAENYVIKNLNLEFRANQAYALVGLNGSGKTTLVKLLTRLYDPTEGAIYVDGRDIREFNVETWHKYIGVVFQDFTHYPFSVKENIGFGDIDHMEDLDRIKIAAEKSGASGFIEKLPGQYDTKLEKLWEGGVELSLGQWQKLALSRAFMSDASLMILDEPTASLDAQTEYEIFSNFKMLVGNTTSIFISHRFSTVRLADWIYVIDNGTIIESGTHESLMKNNKMYAKLFSMQAEAYLETPSHAM